MQEIKINVGKQELILKTKEEAESLIIGLFSAFVKDGLESGYKYDHDGVKITIEKENDDSKEEMSLKDIQSGGTWL